MILWLDPVKYWTRKPWFFFLMHFFCFSMRTRKTLYTSKEMVRNFKHQFTVNWSGTIIKVRKKSLIIMIITEFALDTSILFKQIKQTGAKIRSLICGPWCWFQPVCNCTKTLKDQYLDWNVSTLIMVVLWSKGILTSRNIKSGSLSSSQAMLALFLWPPDNPGVNISPITANTQSPV